MATTDLGYNLPDCDRIKFSTEPTIFYRDNFDDLDKYFKEYERTKASQSVKNELARVERDGQQKLESSTEESWYGLKSRMGRVNWRFLYERIDFVYRDVYKELKDKIWAELDKLLRNNSIAEILKKNFEWNDKELGIFSFDRASLGLTPKYAYYSFKTKQTYQEDLIERVGEGDSTKYLLISDRSVEITLCYEVNLPNDQKLYIDAKNPINLQEIADTGGYLSVVSNIKNCFIHQVPKPKIANAVRIFIDFGCNADIGWRQKIYNGLFGIILSEFFEFMGYSTSIIPYIGYSRHSDKQNKRVYRLLAYQAKKFTQTLETEKLLLSCSDIAFFRTRFFLYAHLLSDSYGDNVDRGIGFNMSREEKQCSMIQYFKNKDKNIDVFYYNVAEIYSEQQVLYNLTYLILNIDNENKKLNAARLGINDPTILNENQLKKKATNLSNNP